MDRHSLIIALFTLLGAALMLLVLIDVFLTVLYARMNTSIISRRLAVAVWHVTQTLGAATPRSRQTILSFGGPALLIVLISTWALGLTLGVAMIFYPHMGSSIRASSGGSTPTDFVTAMYAAAGSMSIVGSASLTPQTAAFRLIYMVNSLVGMCMISLVLTYFMQIYSALQQRNALALKLDLDTGQSGDAAEFITALGRGDDLSTLSSRLGDLADNVAQVKESHHFYPALLYFRFREPLYAVPRLAMVSLDAVSLIKSGLDASRYPTVIEAATANSLWAVMMRLLTGVAPSLIPGEQGDQHVGPDDITRARWMQRFHRALRQLREAGIHTTEDEQAGAERYVALRSQWDHYIGAYRDFMGYDETAIDPAGASAPVADEPFAPHRALRPVG